MVKVARETPLRDEFDLVMEAMSVDPPPDVVRLLWQFFVTGAMTSIKLRNEAARHGYEAFNAMDAAMLREACEEARDGGPPR